MPAGAGGENVIVGRWVDFQGRRISVGKRYANSICVKKEKLYLPRLSSHVLPKVCLSLPFALVMKDGFNRSETKKKIRTSSRKIPPKTYR
jgi:hypothetical protein